MTTSLNQMVIKLGADTSMLSRGMKIAQRDVKRTNRVLQNARTDSEKYAAAAASLQKSLAVGHITNEQYARGLEHLRKKYLGTKEAAENTSTSVSSLTTKIAAAVSGFAAMRGAKGLIDTAAQAQEAKVQLEVFTGSVQTANDVYAKLRDLAASTPITLRGVQTAAVTLKTFGVSTEELLPTLRQLGDISAGNAERFQFLVRAYGQVRSAGRLMGQESLQLINAGFSPLQEISERTGESMASLKKRMEDGKVSFDEIKASIAAATSEGGRYFQMMEKYKQTFSGAATVFKSSIEEIKIDLGEKLLPALAAMVNMGTRAVKGFQALALNLNKTQVQILAAAGAFTSVMVILPKVVAGVKLVIGAVRALIAAQITLQAFSGPAGWAALAAGAAAAAAAIYGVDAAYKAYIQSLENAQDAEGGDGKGPKPPTKPPGGGMTDEQKRLEWLEKTKYSLTEQLKLINLGERAYNRQVMFQRQFTIPQVEAIDYLRQQIALAKERKELQRKMVEEKRREAEELKRQLDMLKKQGQGMMEKNNPVERVSTQLAELNRLLMVNAIDQATYFKERNKILAKEVTDYSSGAPAAMEYGSQSAAQAVQEKFAQDRAEQINKLEAIRLLQQAANRTQEKTNELLREIRPVRGARG